MVTEEKYMKKEGFFSLKKYSLSSVCGGTGSIHISRN